MDPRILVGRFGAPHGVRGELRLQSFTQDPVAIGSYGPLADASGGRRFEITASRLVKDNLLIVRIAGIADRSAAERLTNTELFVAREALPPPEDDEFYLADLVGMTVVDERGMDLGRVSAVPNYGAGDILEIVSPGAGETLLLPFTKAVVPTIDLAARRLSVSLPETVVDTDEQR